MTCKVFGGTLNPTQSISVLFVRTKIYSRILHIFTVNSHRLGHNRVITVKHYIFSPHLHFVTYLCRKFVLHFNFADFPVNFIKKFVSCFFWCLYQILLSKFLSYYCLHYILPRILHIVSRKC